MALYTLPMHVIKFIKKKLDEFPVHVNELYWGLVIGGMRCLAIFGSDNNQVGTRCNK